MCCWNFSTYARGVTTVLGLKCVPPPCLFVCLFVVVFRDRVSLYSPGCSGTSSADQAGLELRDALACVSPATTAQHTVFFKAKKKSQKPGLGVFSISHNRIPLVESVSKQGPSFSKEDFNRVGFPQRRFAILTGKCPRKKPERTTSNPS